MADAAAQDLAQDIAAAFVGGEDAIGDKKCCGARMIGNDAQRGVGRGRPILIASVGKLSGARDQRGKQIGLEIRDLALQHRGHALQTGPGVDGGLGQQVEFPLLIAIELHEDQVPDFYVARFVLAERLVFAGLRRGQTHVVENLGARPAGAGIAHGPEVVLHSQLVNSLRRNALAAPKLIGLFVPRNALLALEDGDVELVLGNAEPLRRGDQLPGKGNRIALEVVAKAEVAQHLEEGVVAAGEADVLQIVVLAAGAHALLRSGGAVVVTALHPEKYIFELVHARRW